MFSAFSAAACVAANWRNKQIIKKLMVNCQTQHIFIYCFVQKLGATPQFTCARMFSMSAIVVSDFPVPGGPCSRQILELAYGCTTALVIQLTADDCELFKWCCQHIQFLHCKTTCYSYAHSG